MLKDAVAVVDIGTYSLTAMIGENGINNNFTIRAIVKRDHEAIDGEDINERSLYNALSDSLRSVSNTAKARLDKVYIGVPGEFLRIYNTEQRSYFNRKKRIKESDLTDLFDGACANLDMGDYEIITRSGVCFFIDGFLRCDDILGAKTSSLSSYVTIYGAKRSFLDLIRKMLAELKINQVYFIPVPLAESLLLFSKEELKSTQILLDCGYLSTTLAVVSGEGCLFEQTFPIGGGHITAYLYDRFGIEFEIAERLKRKVNLSIYGDSGNYVVVYGEGQYNFDIKSANEVARQVIDQLAELFDSSLLNSRVRLPHNVAVNVTGGGISYIRGAAYYFSNRIEMPVNIICPKIAYMSKPDDSSILAVLNYALNYKFY